MYISIELLHVLCFKMKRAPDCKKTSRDRPKSAPYPRLKNSKKTSKCQVFVYSSRNSKFFRKIFFEKNYILKKWTEWRANVSQCRKTERGDPLRFFNIHSVAKHEKIEENFFLFSGENLTMPKKTERRNPLRFSNIHSVAKHQKNAGGTLCGKKISKKKSEKNVSQCRKKLKGGTLWSRPV